MSATRRNALSLFQFKGINVVVHWSFLLLVAWVLLSSLSAGLDLRHSLFRLVYVLLVFACVVLHEFGHALTALHYGIRTRNILLLPIGGVASLERIPEVPRQELLITLAGPAVNLAIALLVGIPYVLLSSAVSLPDPVNGPADIATLLGFLLAANAGLFLFNLLPAFPMDGGRILRSLLAMNGDRLRATRIAANVGRICAAGFVVAAILTGQLMLGLIGVFVFMGASAEQRMVQTQTALRGVQVSQAMRTRYWTLPSSASVKQAADELLAGGDQVLVLTDHGRFDRVITRAELIATVQEGGGDRTLSSITGAVPPAVAPDADVKLAHEHLVSGNWPMLPVVEEGELRGIVELENLSEFIMLHERRPSASPA